MTNQTAVTILKNLEQSLDDYCELNDEGKEAFHMAITALELFGNSEQLKLTQKRKRGHWIHISPEPEVMLGWMPWYCSECKCGVGKHQVAFCPNCGADMRGEEDE